MSDTEARRQVVGRGANGMTPYLIVGLTWITALVCCTVLVIYGHWFFGLVVLILGLSIGYTRKND